MVRWAFIEKLQHVVLMISLICFIILYFLLQDEYDELLKFAVVVPSYDPAAAPKTLMDFRESFPQQQKETVITVAKQRFTGTSIFYFLKYMLLLTFYRMSIILATTVKLSLSLDCVSPKQNS